METQATSVPSNGNGKAKHMEETETTGLKMADVDRGIMRPVVDDKFYVSKDHATVLQIIEKLSGDAPQNVLITGPQGVGKTELVIRYAAKFNRPLLIENCATKREAKDWFGYRDVTDGNIFWHKSDFVRALRMGGCVILLDEFNRLHPTLHNTLYPLLDARRSTYVEEIGEIMNVGKGTVFFATCNIGFSHTGTHALDSAIEDRFSFRLDLDFPAKQETEASIIVNRTGIDPALAKKLARFAADLRKKATGTNATLTRPVSTRQLIATAILMKEMADKKDDEGNPIPIVKALDFTILPTFSKEGARDSEQAQVLQLIQGIFGAGA